MPIDLNTGSSSTEQAEIARSSVAILLCTYNGAQFLDQQLLSIKNQSHRNWRVWVSDDQSTDTTRDILAQCQSSWASDSLILKRGPGQGSTRNFLKLACEPEVTADWYAFCDQDDIWENDKLSRAIKWLVQIPREVPALYCSRTRMIDEDNHEVGYSPLFSKPPGFRNALLQNIANGNTMVFNQAAMDLLRLAGSDVDIVIHDWWLYLLVTSCGGCIFYDMKPTVLYRQHSANLIGADDRLVQRLTRLKSLWDDKYKRWNDLHIKALKNISNKISFENLELLYEFCKFRESESLVMRLLKLQRMGLYKQTMSGNLSLLLGTILRKL